MLRNRQISRRLDFSALIYPAVKLKRKTLHLTPFPLKIRPLQSPTERKKAAENLERESAAFSFAIIGTQANYSQARFYWKYFSAPLGIFAAFTLIASSGIAGPDCVSLERVATAGV